MYSSKHATSTTAASESNQTYASSKILGNQENAGFGTACANQQEKCAFKASTDTGPASHAPLLGVRTAAKKTTRRSAHATRWVHMPRRSRRETMTHKRQIRPHGKQTIAVMIPAMPYFVVTSWLPAAHIANTARDQAKSRSALL